jgi:transcription initiation factor IIE alpha subunit
MTQQTKAKTKRRYAREASKPSATAEKETATKASASKPLRETKIGTVIALLQRKEGATLEEMVEATGWQAHTTRAALTGLRKKGHTIEREKRGEATCYRIMKSA